MTVNSDDGDEQMKEMKSVSRLHPLGQGGPLFLFCPVRPVSYCSPPPCYFLLEMALSTNTGAYHPQTPKPRQKPATEVSGVFAQVRHPGPVPQSTQQYIFLVVFFEHFPGEMKTNHAQRQLP